MLENKQSRQDINMTEAKYKMTCATLQLIEREEKKSSSLFRDKNARKK